MTRAPSMAKARSSGLPAAVGRADVDLARDPLFRAAQAVLLLKLVLVVIVFDPLAFDTFTLVKATVSHALSFMLFALLIWLVLAHGRSLIKWSPVHLAAGSVILAFTIAALFPLDRTVALYGVSRRYLGLTEMLDHGLVYVAAVLLLRSSRDLAGALTVLLATSVPVALYGVVQRLGLDPVAYINASTTRPISTLGQPEIASGYLSVVTATCAAVLLLGWRWLARPGIALIVLAGGAAMTVMSFTTERTGVLGVAAGWLTLLLVVVVGPAASRLRSIGILGAAAIVGAFGVALSPIGPRMTLDYFQHLDVSLVSRLELWNACLRIIASAPFFGAGPDNLAAAYLRFRTEEGAILDGVGGAQTSTHNWLLYIGTSAGLVGLAAFFYFISQASARAIDLARRASPAAIALVPLVAYLGQGLVDVNDIALDWIPWFAAGVIAASTGQSLPALRPTHRRVRRRFATLAGPALVAAALVGMVMSIQRLEASRALQQSEAYVDARRGPEALPHATESVRDDTRRGQYWRGLGRALDASGDFLAAGSAFLNAGIDEPWQPIHWRNLGLMRLKLADQAGALAALRRAAQADPYDAETRDLLARVYLAKQAWQEAADQGALAVRLQPTNPTTYDAPVLANFQLKRWAVAEALVVEALRHADTPLLHLRLAQVYAATDRAAEARAELDRVLAAEPANKEALSLRDFLDGK